VTTSASDPESSFEDPTQRSAHVDAALKSWGTFDRDNPFQLFAEVRERGPVHHVTLADGHEAWLVVGEDEARLALKDVRISKDMRAALAMEGGVVAEGLPGPEFARHMLAVDPPDHTRLRRLVSSAFSVRTVQGLRPRVQAIVDDLLDALAARDPGAPADLVAELAFPLPFIVICELLGVPEPERSSLGRGLVAMLVPTLTPTAYAQAKEASDAVVSQLRELVVAKYETPGDDLVSGLIAARDGDEQLDNRELLSTIFQLIVAGHDTTTTFIGNAVVALLDDPGQLEMLRAEPLRIPAAVEELLRYDAPVPHSTFRYALESVEIADCSIPAGAQIIVCLAAANRDPSRFADPDRLDLERTEGRHLAFGAGIHHCLGAPLARLEGQVTLGSLIQRFPDLRLGCERTALRWGHGDGLVLRGLSELPVIPGAALPR
jgi:cytochrome P450